jgi:hypothetical protein
LRGKGCCCCCCWYVLQSSRVKNDKDHFFVALLYP